jgi:hypothetical protein
LRLRNIAPATDTFTTPLKPLPHHTRVLPRSAFTILLLSWVVAGCQRAPERVRAVGASSASSRRVICAASRSNKRLAEIRTLLSRLRQIDDNNLMSTAQQQQQQQQPRRIYQKRTKKRTAVRLLRKSNSRHETRATVRVTSKRQYFC